MIDGSWRQLLKCIHVLWQRSMRILLQFLHIQPTDEVLQLAFVLSVKLGIKDFGDLIFGFAIDVDWRWRWLDVVGDGVQS